MLAHGASANMWVSADKQQHATSCHAITQALQHNGEGRGGVSADLES